MRLPVCIVSAPLLFVSCQAAFAQRMNVKIVNRQSSETEYSYQVPGYYSSTSNGRANCYGNSTYIGSTNGNLTTGNSTDDTNCSASSTTIGSIAPPKIVSYSVTGATFSLLLPDGRIVVVNCHGKVAGGVPLATLAAIGGVGQIRTRSCRMPLVDDIQAEFKGKNAKLEWPASVDGSKFESETYTVLAILEKQSGSSNVNAAAQAGTGSSIAPAQQGDAATERWTADAICSRKAAEQGDAKAQSTLAACYDTGIVVPQDDVQAAYWYRKAADQGDATAEQELAELYYNGQGVPQDYAAAVAWYQKAAEQGDASAQTFLGDLYFLGKAVPEDDGQAAVWWRKAAEQDVAYAQYMLGLAYGFGLGVPQDYAEAYFWLDLAAAGVIEGLEGAKQEDVAKHIDDAASHLTPADLSHVQERARKWSAEHPAKTSAR